MRQRGRELAGIDHGRPGVALQHRFDLDLLADRGLEQLRGLDDQRIHVGRLRLQRLLAGEGEQMPRQLGALLSRLVDHFGDGDGLESCASDAARMSMEPMMTVSMLLKSWAMPPVRWPIASIFCACRS